MVSQAYQAFVQIRKYGFAVFSKLLQFMVSQSLARFCKDSKMDFRKDLQMRKSWFFARFHNGPFADEPRTLPAEPALSLANLKFVVTLNRANDFLSASP